MILILTIAEPLAIISLRFKMKKIFLILILIFTFIYAISCNFSNRGTITKEDYKAVDVVFVSYIINVNSDNRDATFLIIKSLKPALQVGSIITIYTPHTSCGFVFTLNHEWYIWAYDNNG